VLFIEDDVVLRGQLATLARRSGFQAAEAGSVDEALSGLSRLRPDCVVSDINMPGESGLVLPEWLRAHGLDIPLVMLTGEVSPDQVDQLRRYGVDCLIKPIGAPMLIHVLKQLVKTATTAGATANGTATEPDWTAEIVGNSPVMRRLREQIRRVGRTRATVLIEGPSGSGKELVARALHRQLRGGAPFVALNCAAVPEGLVESTFFGHERGAFTGALRSAQGAFERANGGTVLLDEVSEMRLDLQAKLLRVLQERSVQRVGGDGMIPVDVQVIATTNRDLVSAVERGEFREDLYYRLNVMHLRVPSLADRREDIPLIVSRLLERLGAQHGVTPPAFAPDALAALCDLDWPGNVRQLANCLERAVLHTDDGVVTADTILSFSDAGPRPNLRGLGSALPLPRERPDWVRALESLDLDSVTHVLMHEALRRTGGNRRRAATLLGVHVRTLRRHLAEHPLAVGD
jgi:DNA-binding NtrC family response regulator